MEEKSILSLNDTTFDKTVRIQGTDYDRKRKVTSAMIEQVKLMRESGKSYKEIGEHFGIDHRVIRYNVDPEYRALWISRCSGRHTGTSKCLTKDRIAYKRGLVKAGKDVIYTMEV